MNAGTAGSSLSPSLLAWLRCFDAAARCGSFTRAAQELHVSQGAVSQQVKKLEEWIGHVLLLRTATGLMLTSEGERLYPATRESFSDLGSAVRRLRGAPMGEPVNVSCSPSFAMLWLTLRLGDFYRVHPDVHLRIVGESGRMDSARMVRDGIAATVRFCPPVHDDPRAVDLFDEWLMPVASPAFMAEHPELRGAWDIDGKHLLHASDPDEDVEPTDEWTQWLQDAGVDTPRAALRQGTQFNLSQLAVQAALGGQGIAMGRAALVLGYLLQGRLVVPFPMRVRARGRYRFSGSPSHMQAPSILAWLRGQAARFEVQRDALFDSKRIQTSDRSPAVASPCLARHAEAVHPSER